MTTDNCTPFRLAAIAALIVCGCQRSSTTPAISPTATTPIESAKPGSTPPATTSNVNSAAPCGPRVDGVDFHFGPPAPPESYEPQLSTSSNDVLFQAMLDWQGFHQKWSGKCIEVHGTVYSNSFTIDGLEEINLLGLQGRTLQCIVERGSWIRCQPGQEATLRGLWDHFALEPTLLHCQILGVQGEPTSIRISATDFAKAFSTDFDAAAARFKDAEVVIEGTISDIQPHLAEIEGLTPDNSPESIIGLSTSADHSLYLYSSCNPGGPVLASRRLQAGDSIIAKCSTSLTEFVPGRSELSLRASAIALREDLTGAESKEPTVADNSGDEQAAWKMTGADFMKICDADIKAKRTQFAPGPIELTGRLLRFDPLFGPTMRIDDGSDRIGLQCYLQTGSNWTVALPGQDVTIRGRQFPLGTFSHALLDCRVVRVDGCAKVYSVDELLQFVKGSGKVDLQRHMRGVAVTGVLSRRLNTLDQWHLVSEGTSQAGVNTDFARQFHPIGGFVSRQVTLCGQLMCPSDEEFYLSDCLLLPPGAENKQ